VGVGVGFGSVESAFGDFSFFGLTAEQLKIIILLLLHLV